MIVFELIPSITLFTSNIEEKQSYENHCQVQNLTFKILLMKEQSTKQETHHYGTTSNHTHNTNHGTI